MKYLVEYKTIAYFATVVDAESEIEAKEIAAQLDIDDFHYYDRLDCAWEYSDCYKYE